MENYAQLSPSHQVALLKKLSVSLVANDLEKASVLNSPFVHCLLDNLISKDLQVVNYSLVIINSLLYLEAAPSIFLGLDLVTRLVSSVHSQEVCSSLLGLRNLSLTFKALARILYYNNDSCVYHSFDELFLDKLTEVLSLGLSVDNDDFLQLSEALNNCLFNLYNLLPSLSGLSGSVKTKFGPLLLNKIMCDIPVLMNFLIPGLEDSWYASSLSLDQKCKLERKVSKQAERMATDFALFETSNTLPVNSPVNLSLVPVYFPSLLYSFAAMINDSDDGLVIPKSVYYTICGFLNSENPHLRLSSLNVLQKYGFTIFQSCLTIYWSSVPTEEFLYHTVSKYLPHLIAIFETNAPSTTNIPLSNSFKPPHLVAQLCRFGDNYNWSYRSQIRASLLTHGVVPKVFEKINLSLAKLQKTFEKSAILTRSKNFSKSKIYFKGCSDFKSMDDSNLLFKFASIDVLHDFIQYFKIFNCFSSTGDKAIKHEILDHMTTSTQQGDSKKQTNCINLIAINVLALLLKITKKFSSVFKNPSNDASTTKIFKYISRNWYKILLLNKFAQSVLSFLKYFSQEVALLRSFFTFDLNNSLLFDIILKLSDITLEDVANYFCEMDYIQVSINKSTFKNHNIKEPNNNLSSPRAKFTETIVSFLTSFENLRKIVSSILVTKTLANLWSANLVIEFSPPRLCILGFRNSNGGSVLVESLAKNLNADYKSCTSKKQVESGANFWSFILSGHYNAEVDYADLEKMSVVNYSVVSDNSSVEIDTDNFNTVTVSNFIESSNHPVSLEINCSSLVDFKSVYDLKLSCVSVLLNMVYEATNKVKYEYILPQLSLRQLLQCLLSSESSNYIVDFKIRVLGFLRNMLADVDIAVRTLNAIEEWKTSIPLKNTYYISAAREAQALDIFYRHVTLTNVINSPALVSNILINVVNLVSLNESTRNVAIKCDKFLNIIKLLLQLELPRIQSQSYYKSTDNVEVLTALAQLECDISSPCDRESFVSSLVCKYNNLFESDSDNKDYSTIKVNGIWVLINLLWDQEDYVPISLGSYRDQDHLSIIDRFIILKNMDFECSLRYCQKAKASDVSQKALIALRNFDLIENELGKLGEMS